MNEPRNARDLPGSALYLPLAGLFVASQFAFPLFKATAVILAAPCAWLAGLLLGLRREHARD